MKARLWLGLCLLCALQSCTPDSQQVVGSEPFIEWASNHALAIDSLEPPLSSSSLDAIETTVGASRLVGLGESRHDTREQLLFKALLARHLIEDLGFRALLLEESVVHAEPLDRYVTTGEGDPLQILNRLAGWYLWNTEEMLTLVQWLRDFNLRAVPEQQVRIFGIDITAPAPGVEAALALIKTSGIDTELDATRLGLDLQRGDHWPTTWQRYSELADAQCQEIADSYDQLLTSMSTARDTIIESSSERAYEHALFLAEVGRMGNNLFCATDRAEGGVVRESGMATATLRILDQQMPGEKAILWAHNLHVAKGAFRMPGLADGELVPMGVQLSQEMGDAYLAIGASFGTGAYPADLPPGERVFEIPSTQVMDGALAAVGMPLFMIDLRLAGNDDDAREWLLRDREWIAQDSNAVLVPARAFDVVFFVREVSRSQPNPMALERYRTMGR